jgi:ATP adenylyltransferase
VKHLWAPWRLAYVAGPKDAGCFLCEALASKDDRANLLVHRAGHGFLILNRYPYNRGHLMAVPNRHVARLDALTKEEADTLMHLTVIAVRALEQMAGPQGFNVGMNLGRAAGAGIEDHLHMHVVPRWISDTNFMPVIGETKVLPEHLEDTYDRLTEALGALRSA